MDIVVFNFVNGLAGKFEWLDYLGIFFAEYLQYFVVLGLLVFLAFGFKKYWKMVFLSLASAVLARFGVASVIRWIYPRLRPFAENHVNLLVHHDLESSFPSGHASFFFALATVVYLRNKKAGLAFYVASVLISLSRVLVGIHWPSDILAGAVVGIVSGLAVAMLAKRLERNAS